jgi:hypothetical protein
VATVTDPDYFTLAELRALPDMDDGARYTDARCLAAAAYVTSIIERECDTSFIARTVTDEPHDGGVYSIPLDKRFVISVTSAKVNGVTVTGTLSVVHGVLERYASATANLPTFWACGRRNVLVTYQAGYSSTPPSDIKEAALQATRARLLTMDSQAGIEDRRTSLSTDQGTINYVIAGENRPTGYPEVDAVILGWKNSVGPGVA